MSIDATPKLSKEEKEAKRARKEAKKAKKAAEAAATGGESAAATAPTTAAASEASTPAATGDSEKAEKKKRKEEKKRKRAEAEAETGAGTQQEAAVESEGQAPAKKEKKDKKGTSDTAAPVEASSASSSALVQPTPFNSSHDAYLTSQNVTLEPRLFPPFLSIPSLPVNPKIGSWLGKFKSPTPIQACSWPALLGGRDVVAIAETGSGKTLGFGVPGLHLLSSLSEASPASSEEGLSKKQAKKAKKAAASGGPVIQMLVLAPTRELALQSHETLNELGGALGIKSVCLYGGVGKADQLRDLARDGNRIVVGTPGRILDLADSGDMDLSS